MRTIKFRGLEANPYCEELRTFLYGTPLFITNEENYILPNFWDYEGLNKFKVLKKTISQFTGSVDCKGNEIYEGDIVLLREGFHPRKRPIVFSEYGAWYIGELGISFGQMKANGFVDCEVIGNIYENPELL